jgi:hypothetical protein
MARRYRIRVYGKARENPDPAMLAQIVILIGRRLQAEQLDPQRVAHTTGDLDDAAGSPHGNARRDGFEPGCEASRSNE